MTATRIGNPDILFGVMPEPLTFDLPEDCVYHKLRMSNEEFATLHLIRRCGDTVFTERWIAGCVNGVVRPELLQEAGGRYNEQWKAIVRAGHVQSIRRGDPPIDTRILMSIGGEWFTGSVLEDGEDFDLWTGSGPVLCYTKAELDYLPWCHLPETISEEKTNTNQQENAETNQP